MTTQVTPTITTKVSVTFELLNVQNVTTKVSVTFELLILQNVTTKMSVTFELLVLQNVTTKVSVTWPGPGTNINYVCNPFWSIFEPRFYYISS